MCCYTFARQLASIVSTDMTISDLDGEKYTWEPHQVFTSHWRDSVFDIVQEYELFTSHSMDPGLPIIPQPFFVINQTHSSAFLLIPAVFIARIALAPELEREILEEHQV